MSGLGMCRCVMRPGIERGGGECTVCVGGCNDYRRVSRV